MRVLGLWVDFMLQAVLASHPQILRDSKSLVRDLDRLRLQIDRSYWLINADVISMYPYIPGL